MNASRLQKVNRSMKFGILAVALGACTNGTKSQNTLSADTGLRPLSKTEAKADLNEIAQAIRTYYGPLQYKEKRFNFKVDDLIAQADQELVSAKDDGEVFSTYQRLLTGLHDAHVSIEFPSSSVAASKYAIPIFLTSVEGHALVDAIDGSLKNSGINRGDEVISVDGKDVADFLPIIKKYKTFSNDVTDQQLIYMVFSRPFYMTELIPTQSTAHIVLARPDDTLYTLDLVWRKTAAPSSAPMIISKIPSRLDFTLAGIGDFNDAASGSLLQMGAPAPFFANPRTAQMFGWVNVSINADYKKKYGLTDKTTPSIFAVMYRYKGQNILMIRQPTYSPTDFPIESYMRAYAALMNQYESLVDVLVLDQGHNPGGSGAYCSAFFSLFTENDANAAVEFVRADRKWIFDLKIDAQTGLPSGSEESLDLLAMGTKVEEAYDAGQFLTSSPISVFSNTNVITPGPYVWTKPLLILTDELAGSCGDAFPMLIKANKTAKIFGNRTVGAGGNVESIVTLTNSRAAVHLTRGLFTAYNPNGQYPDDSFVENNGVTPDYPYTIAVSDYRMGYLKYVQAFSDKALEQIEASPAPGSSPFPTVEPDPQ